MHCFPFTAEHCGCSYIFLHVYLTPSAAACLVVELYETNTNATVLWRRIIRPARWQMLYLILIQLILAASL